MRKVLARGIAAGIALIVLAAASPTVGGAGEAQTYSGEFAAGGQVFFRLNPGDAPKVDRIMIDGITAVCRGGTGSLRFQIHGSTPVLSDRSFRVRSEDGSGGKALVKGRFTRRFTRAKGVARVYGSFRFEPNGSARCDSGRQAFVAR
jgi:hypothetical protein